MEIIRFAGREHKAFYNQMLAKTRNNDTYHRALFYTMGICAETRRNIHSLFDFNGDGIKPEGLAAPWQTGGTRRLCRLAFNLWNDWTEEGKKTVPLPTSCLTAALPPTFLKPSGFAIPNIAGAWNTPRPIFLQRCGSH